MIKRVIGWHVAQVSDDDYVGETEVGEIEKARGGNRILELPDSSCSSINIIETQPGSSTRRIHVLFSVCRPTDTPWHMSAHCLCIGNSLPTEMVIQMNHGPSFHSILIRHQ